MSTALALLAGVLWLHALPALPSAAWALIACLLPFLAGIRRLHLLLALGAGFSWALLQAHVFLGTPWPAALESRDVVVEGRIDGLVEPTERGQRFVFAIDTVHWHGVSLPGGWRARLNTYTPLALPAPGTPLRLTVRLKRPHGYANPGGMDYEAWLYQQDLQATGYVRGPAATVAPSARAATAGLTALRAELARAMTQAAPPAAHGALLPALAVGAQGGIGPADWDVLNRTGTTHLVSISGAHISLIALLIYGAVRAVWARLGPAALWLPAPRAAAAAALLAALGYALLAGWSVPTQRSFFMLAVFMLAQLGDRAHRPDRALALALAVVLLADTRAVLATGFWLSFGTVAILAWLLYRPAHGARAVLRMHLALGLLLIPLTLWFFERASLASPLANLIAVPVVGLVITPLALIGALLAPGAPAWAYWPLLAGQEVTAWLWAGLAWIAQWPYAQVVLALPGVAAGVLALLGGLWLMAPRGLPARWLGAVLWLPLLFSRPPGPAPDTLALTVLDVGQGLAVVARTAAQTLVYDAGPRYSASFDTGAAVVLPYLHAQGVRRIDTLIVSHGDNDHRGGVASLLKAMPVSRIMTNAPAADWPAVPVLPCRAGQNWQDGGVRFEILHPVAGQRPVSDNEDSCVLRIAVAGQAILLPGDIEQAGERALLRRVGGALAAAVLVVPHHGSRSSSSAAFLAAVRPRLALASAGYLNRWGMPRPEIVQRYRDIGATVLDTAQDGALELHLRPGAVPVVTRWREASRRFWHWIAAPVPAAGQRGPKCDGC